MDVREENWSSDGYGDPLYAVSARAGTETASYPGAQRVEPG